MAALVVACFLLIMSARAEVESCRTYTVVSTGADCPQMRSTVGGSTVCAVLQEIFRDLSAFNPASVDPPCTHVGIDISPGEHVLSSPVAISGLFSSLRVRGIGTAMIRCADDIVYSTGDHSLLFDGLDMLQIDGVSVYGCDRPLRVANTGNVSIIQSSFSFFTAGSVDIYNCFELHLIDTVFTDNTANGLIRDSPFRGNAGGIAVGVYRIPGNHSTIYIRISNCTFIRNRAEPMGMNFLSTSELFRQKIFTGRGGGIGIYVSENSSVNIIIEDSYFEGNFATGFGGGVYIVLSGEISNHSATVSRSMFLHNEGCQGGGGFHLGYLFTSSAVHAVSVTDSLFVNNTAIYGGGSYVFPGIGSRIGVSVIYKNCTFEQNSAQEYGIALGLLSADLFVPHDLFNPYIIEDCVFSGNSGNRGGIVSVIYSPLVIKGQNEFSNNTGPSLRVIGATLSLEGRIDFVGNNAESFDGGALYVTSFGQIILHRGSELNFVGNNGNLGGALVVESQKVVSGFTRLAFNPLCFLRYADDPVLSPLEWTEVQLTFERNAAIVGPAVYINQLDLCSWYKLGPPFFDRANTLRWPFVNFASNLNAGHPPDVERDPLLYIQTPSINLNVTSPKLIAFPGQLTDVNIRTLDELGSQTSAVIRLNDITVEEQSDGIINVNDNVEQTYAFQPNLVAFQPIVNAITISYVVNTDSFTVNSTVTVSINDVSTTQTESTVQQSVPFTAQVCPPGYVLRSQSEESSALVCVCDNFNSSQLVQCEFNVDLVLSPHLWSKSTTSSSGTFSLHSYSCPPGYCRLVHNTSLGERTYGSVFTYTQPDLQCSCNRSGILCGNCPEGHSVSALLNRCVTCNDSHALLIVAVIVIDILITLIILFIPYPLPAWVYPCLFYIQTVPYIAESFPITFATVHRPLYYVSSAFALYFPYDFCLYRGMSALVSYFLRYLPLLIVVPTCIVALLVRHKKFRPFEWYGVWNLIVLMYSHVIYTSMSVLNCPIIAKEGSQWYINGNVSCFTGGHLPLALFAIIVLTITALMVPLVAVVPWKVPQTLQCLLHLTEPLTRPFQPKFFWWAGFELSRRFFILLFTVPFPGQPIVPSFFLIISTTIYLMVKPYKSLVATVIEALLSANVLILLFMVSNPAITEDLLLQSTQLQSVITEDGSCPDPVSGVSRLTWLLLPFYYLPLWILVCGMIVSFLLYIWYRCGDLSRKKKTLQGHHAAFELTTNETYHATNFGTTSVHL